MLNIFCEQFDFSPLAEAFEGEVVSDCGLSAEIVITEKRAKEQAEEFGHSYLRELHYLAVHGLWHLLGYDHMTETDKLEMREKEEKILSKLGITRE